MKTYLPISALILFICVTINAGYSAPMAGIYTIGSSGNYTTFTAAVSDLVANSVSGPVIFNVQAGTYNERVVIPSISGASATNTITFRGINKLTVILRYSPTGLQSTLVFDGADFIRFDQMTIQNLGTANGRAIFLTNQADYNVISNCKVIVDSVVSSTTLAAIESGGNESSIISQGHNADNNSIENNEIIGGYYGVILNGPGPSSGSIGLNNRLCGNTFRKQYFYAAFMQYQRAILIQRNQIDIGVRYSSSFGIRHVYCQFSSIDGNIIRPGQYGIYLQYENYYSNTDSTTLTNNMIYGFANSSTQAGITTTSYCYNIKIYHNSIRLDGATAGSMSNAALVFSLYVYNLRIQNNILASSGSSMMISITSGYPNGVPAVIDYNDYYYPSSLSNNMFYNNSTFYFNLAAWKSAADGLSSGHDVNSLGSINPNFISLSDLHLNSSYASLKGIPLWIQKDVDGDNRCIYEASLGADESRYKGAKPGSGFFTNDTACYPSNVALFNQAGPSDHNGYFWYVNQMFKSTDRDYIIVFNSMRKDTVTLITENCYGKDTFTKVIVVDPPKAIPTPDFISSANSAHTNQYINLFDISSDCPDHWKWEISPAGSHTFKTGSSDSAQNPSFLFQIEGKYTVCLTVTNVKGKSAKRCRTEYIEIENPAVMCMPPFELSGMWGTVHDDIEGAGYQGVSNTLVCNHLISPCIDTLLLNLSYFDVKGGDYLQIYDDTGTAGKPLWNKTAFPSGLGNGMTSTSPGFQGSFISYTGKMYLVWYRGGKGYPTNYLTGGFIAKWSGNLTHALPPVAKFLCPDTICTGKPVSFINQSTGRNMTYSWTFDTSGFTTFQKNPDFTFTQPGKYQVKLKVSGCKGDSTFTKTIVAIDPNAAPFVDFNADIRQPAIGLDVVKFNDLNKGCVDSWKWIISPSTFTVINGYPNSSSPSILFDSTGCYDVTLVAGNNGYFDSIFKKCYIKAIEYCIPQVSAQNSDIGISLVKFGSINNSSSIGLVPYTDYTATRSATVIIGSKYKITIGRNTVFNTMNRKVWIDYNHDGDFTDSAEMVLFESSTHSMVWDTSITIPFTSTIGVTRMRIGTSIGSGSNLSCGLNPFGEFEDYRLVIIPDTTPPVITLRGLDTVYVEQCGGYIDSGATAFTIFAGVPIPLSVYTNNNLNTMIPGTYWYHYFAMSPVGNLAQKNRSIIVTADTVRPLIKLNSSTDTMISVYMPWTETGYTAADTCSGLKNVVVTGHVDSSLIGDYTITYTAFDFNNNSKIVKRIVHVRDTTSPVITLNGNSTMNLLVYSNFIDPGVFVMDNYDSKPVITVTGKVDTAHIGVYDLYYKAIDKSGNISAILKRTVEVFDTISPVVSIFGPASVKICRYEVLKPVQDSVLISDNYYKKLVIQRSGDYITDYLVFRRLGTYTLTYFSRDSSGNLSKPVNKTVIVENCPQNGMNEVNDLMIKVYPNPNDGQFYVDIDLSSSEKTIISVINLLGETVSETELNTGKGTFKIDLMGINEGIYMIRIRSGEFFRVEKLMVKRGY